MNEVAQTIFEQLGGNRFAAMTGAKHFVRGPNWLQFSIGRGAFNGINRIKITLDVFDTYTMEFFKRRGTDCKRISIIHGIYADRLQARFTAETDFDTHL